MNHYVCCPLIVLSSALHTGTNQLPWMKHDLQAEFWEAREVFRKEGEQSFSMICSTFQMCLQMQTGWPRGQTTHILDWTALTIFELLVPERCFQGSGRSKHGICQSLNLLLFRPWVSMDITCNFSVWRQSRLVAVARGSSFVLSILHVAAIMPARRTAGTGQDCWEVGDVSCAGYLWILACLTGCPLCGNKRIIVASKNRQWLRI